MRFGSVCSGIEAASCAWHPLGWRAAFLSEIEPFPSAVLAHHYPTVPNLGDMTKFKEWPDAAIDVLVGGTPCQSFSVAGLRKGLADPRGNLMLTYLAIAERFAPRWLVWENVPGVLSSNGGRDFGTLLGGLAELGYGFAYRVLDAQYVRVESHSRAVPQRRRRVFVVGHLGDWRRAAAVLFERESLLGHPAPRREAGQRVAATLTRGAESSGRGGYAGRRQEDDVNIVVANTLLAKANSSHQADRDNYIAVLPPVARALTTSNQRIDAETETLVTALNWQAGGKQTTLGGGPVSSALVKEQIPGVQIGPAVRRLTPRECERLQGFPDDYTRITVRGKPAADGPRYKALGNSMAVPVMRWIGERIQAVESTLF
ncbi:DNA cytosine methyltransferase [Paraburkholderia graminis]|uniref:DNA cytosine methyltransferase n=1 Tax=Paraburkholderia graminis TaxID=60548 RepID=UPI0038B703D9